MKIYIKQNDGSWFDANATIYKNDMPLSIKELQQYVNNLGLHHPETDSWDRFIVVSRQNGILQPSSYSANAFMERPGYTSSVTRFVTISPNSKYESFSTAYLADTVARSNSGYIPRYNPSGRNNTSMPASVLVSGTPVYNCDVVNKKYVDENFLCLNGRQQILGDTYMDRVFLTTISGNDARFTNITAENLTVTGTTYTEDNETLRIADNIVELNSTKVDNSTTLSGIAINKDENSTYGVMYDPTDDTVKLGLGSTNEGVFSFNQNEGQPLTVRDDSSKIEDGAIMVFDKSKNKLIDSGYTIDTFKQWVRDYIESYMSTTTTIDADGSEIIEMTVADNLISEKDGILEIGG